jgi:Fe-S-cluster containining protein
MDLPAADAQLVQIMDAALAEASDRAGSWLACRPGCTQCCHGAFAINALDAARLRDALHAAGSSTLEAVQRRAQAWVAEFGPDFPGDRVTGILGTSEEDQARFEEFAQDAACPALNPESGLCDVYAGRPMTCRAFGPPTRMGEGDALGCCELCFVGASEQEIAACEMPVPWEIEEQLVAQAEDAGETVVAFALLR